MPAASAAPYETITLLHIFTGFPVLPGNLMYAHIHFLPNNAYITLDDVTRGRAGDFTYRYDLPKGLSIRPDGTAEWIDERMDEGLIHRLPSLAYSTITFTSAEVSVAGVSKRAVGSTSLSHAAVSMWTCQKPIEMARPLGFAKGGTQFEIQWLKYGHTDPC
jgi:hypothetical protein